MKSAQRFYPIFNSSDWLERLLPQGIKLAQLRIKHTDQPLLRAEIRRSLQLARQYGTALVINDHWQLALEEGAEWLHLGQEDIEEADVTAIRKSGIRLGISTHSHAELDTALSYQPDYLALGPVYPTQTKQMPWDPQGLERVSEWKQRIGNTPLCAIGGISLERAPGVFAAGADLIAVVSDITAAVNPAERVQDWLTLVNAAPPSEGLTHEH
ncbi:thiamine phosphate synthase [Nitrincola iocasae]|uniref:Thiamine-phosphate synthase n=1 Tax=Nitrincola iocasae TaxID=2614693 RepID=A0A5J6LHX1_9GAMM|nr:thiamine phosphate synthase [Nitrincola iocasae]QEW08145.1 thiamine phosphate synthase [Nitrincola iocasae]